MGRQKKKKDHIYETISNAKDGKAKWRWTSWKLLLLKLICSVLNAIKCISTSMTMHSFKTFIIAGKMEQFCICVFFLYFPFASLCVVFTLELHVHIAFISITPRAGLLKKI